MDGNKLVKKRLAQSSDLRAQSATNDRNTAGEDLPYQRSSSLPNSVTRSKTQTLLPTPLRFVKPGKRFKAIKRESTYLVNNVPILGAGAPRPTVLHTLPDQRTKSVLHSLLVLGSTSCGKSSLLERYVQKVFYNENQPTIGPKFFARNIYESEGDVSLTIRLQMWDMPGEDLLRCLVSTYIPSADTVFVLYSVHEQLEFRAAQGLVQEVKDKGKENAIIFLLGTKIDTAGVEGSSRVPTEFAQQFAQDENIFFQEISSLTGQGIEEVFVQLVATIKSRHLEMITPPRWTPDREASSCMACHSKWTVTNRRHHCRKCGGLFCARCASSYVPIPAIGKTNPARVCDDCFEILTKQEL